MRFQFTVFKTSRAPFTTVMDLEEVADARREAMRTLGDLVRDQAGKAEYGDISIEVHDDQGNLICRSAMTTK